MQSETAIRPPNQDEQKAEGGTGDRWNTVSAIHIASEECMLSCNCAQTTRDEYSQSEYLHVLLQKSRKKEDAARTAISQMLL